MRTSVLLSNVVLLICIFIIGFFMVNPIRPLTYVERQFVGSHSDITEKQEIIKVSQATTTKLTKLVSSYDEDNKYMDMEVFEAICIADTNCKEPPSSQVSVTYVNGSWQTLLEAQLEALYLSEVRKEPIRLVYNSGVAPLRSCLCSRKLEVEVNHPACIAILEHLNHFFSDTSNAGRQHTIIFYSDGGAIVQKVLDQTPYASRVQVCGISPRVYVRGGGKNVQHYRVFGDMLSLLDYSGFLTTNVTTLPYSSSCEGLYSPSLRCPNYKWAISGIAETGCSRTTSHFNHTLSVVELGEGRDVLGKVIAILERGDTSAEQEINPVSQTRIDLISNLIFSVFRILDLSQLFFSLSVVDPRDKQVLFLLLTTYSLGVCQQLFILFTNVMGRRERYRTARLVAHSLSPFITVVILVDLANCYRNLFTNLLTHSHPLLTGLFFSASGLGGSILGLDIFKYFLPKLRHRVQRAILSSAGGGELATRRLVLRDRERRMGVQELIGAIHSIFFFSMYTALNGIGIQLPREITGHCNVTDVSNTTDHCNPNNATWGSSLVSNQVHNATLAWQNGDVLVITQMINLFVVAVIMMINVAIVIRLIRRIRQGR
ncbi:DUF687 family protein [Chlamydia ibidis]|nr:DUF687 family protein [Chlamydia ibidis]